MTNRFFLNGSPVHDPSLEYLVAYYEELAMLKTLRGRALHDLAQFRMILRTQDVAGGRRQLDKKVARVDELNTLIDEMQRRIDELGRPRPNHVRIGGNVAERRKRIKFTSTLISGHPTKP